MPTNRTNSEKCFKDSSNQTETACRISPENEVNAIWGPFIYVI